eukprot:750307-Hanusia_phi.AAC.1
MMQRRQPGPRAGRTPVHGCFQIIAAVQSVFDVLLCQSTCQVCTPGGGAGATWHAGDRTHLALPLQGCQVDGRYARGPGPGP